jgi:predicted dehydrogenase
LDDGTRIVEACRKAGVRLTVNFSFRYRPAIELARQLIQDGVLGDICGIQTNLFQFKGASYWVEASPRELLATGEPPGSKPAVDINCDSLSCY